MQNPEKEQLVIEINKAKPEDAEEINNVYYKTWLDTYPNEEIGITVEDIEDSFKDSFSKEYLDQVREKIMETTGKAMRLVAKKDDLIVGVATMARNEDNNQLRTIYVLPEFQGQGVGKKLWTEAKKFCDPTKDIIVNVAVYSQKTIEFYKNIGFEDTGKRFTDEQFKTKSGAVIPEMEMVIKAE